MGSTQSALSKRHFVTNKYLLLAVLVLVFFLEIPAANILRPHGTVLYSTLDSFIPFVPEFVIFYLLFFIFIVIPVVLFWKKEFIISILRSYILLLSIALITYIVFQTEVVRPVVNPNNSIFEKLVSIIYSHDPSRNLMPSIHVSLSVLSALWLSKYKPRFKILAVLTGALIAVSTVFIKQHVVIDVFTGALLAICCYYLFSKQGKKG